MRRKLSIVIKVLAFVILLSMILAECNHILMTKDEESRISSFYEEERDSLEAVFIGSSHIFVTAYPFQLWEDYGIKSSVLGGNGMGVPMEYYCVKDAIRRQHPDVIVVELYKAYLDEKLEYISYTHGMANAMPRSANMLRMLTDLIPKENRAEFAFPLYLYHARWKELTQEDFEEQVCHTKGASPQFNVYDASAFTEVEEKETQEVPKTAMTYIEKMIDVCAENNVELIFTVMPYEASGKTKYQQKIFNKLGEELADRNVPYYNFFHMMDEVGIDVRTDFCDDAHLNYEGGQKVTAYFGEMLSERGLGEKGGKDSQWDEDMKAWRSHIKSKQIKMIDDKNEYLDFISEGNYEYILMVKDSSDFTAFLDQKGTAFDIKLPEGRCIYIYDDGKKSVYPADGGKVETEFNERWVQSTEGKKPAVMLDKETYKFSEDLKIFVYDKEINQMIDTVGINYSQDKVVR